MTSLSQFQTAGLIALDIIYPIVAGAHGSFRFAGCLLVLSSIAAIALASSRRLRWRWPWGLWVAAVLMSFMPFDVSVWSSPGPPRFVPVVMGHPNGAGLEAAARGEIVLGGCIAHANDPAWMWIW